MLSETYESINRTCIDLILNEPFYGHFLSGIVKQIDKTVDTVEIQLRNRNTFIFAVNPTYWEKLDKLQRYGSLKHQILHLIFKHPIRVNQYFHKRIFGIAADLVVNQYIAVNHLHENAILLSNFPDLKLNKNESVGYYYKRLLELLESTDENEEEEDAEGGAAPTDGTQNDDSQEKNGEEEQKDKDTPPNSSPNQSQNSSQNRLKDLLSNPGPLAEHSGWENQYLSTSEEVLLEGTLTEIMRNSYERVKYTGYGNLPGQIITILTELMESLHRQLDWRRALRIFAASSSRTRIKNTIRRPSKRFGTIPGIKVKQKQHLVVVIDTSGSIQQEELVEFFSEVYHIWRAGAVITVLECDSTIQRRYPYRGSFDGAVMGGGGTSFEAPIVLANDEIHPDGLIYFTDAYALKVRVKSRCPVFWLISPGGAKPTDEYWEQLEGRVIKMNKRKKK